VKQNYFELFKLPVDFKIDEADLAARHRAIITQIHPDKFTDKSAVEQRVALQWATFANEAFDVLKSPIRRAQYLIQRQAPELATESARVTLPPAFLMQQMEWRELLEDGAVESVRAEVAQAHTDALNALAKNCAAQDWAQVQVNVAECQFIENFIKQLPTD
jgi:molecular chaperone HscB